jgi:hypothetical protein
MGGMRKLLVVAVVLVSACSFGRGARSLGSGVKDLGGKVAKLGKAAADLVPVPSIGVDAGAVVDVDRLQDRARGAIVAEIDTAARAQIAQYVPSEPIVIGKSFKSSNRPAATRQPRRSHRPDAGGSPAITVQRTTDTSGDQIWKNLSQQGSKTSCEKYAGGFDACTSECTASLRQQSMLQLAPEAPPPITCQCTQGHSQCN